METENLYSLVEAAKILGMHKSTMMRTLVLTGILPIYAITPRKRFIHKDDLDRYIQSCKGFYKAK